MAVGEASAAFLSASSCSGVTGVSAYPRMELRFKTVSKTWFCILFTFRAMPGLSFY